jgi:hypothetical protein
VARTRQIAWQLLRRDEQPKKDHMTFNWDEMRATIIRFHGIKHAENSAWKNDAFMHGLPPQPHLL